MGRLAWVICAYISDSWVGCRPRGVVFVVCFLHAAGFCKFWVFGWNTLVRVCIGFSRVLAVGGVGF